MSIHRDTPWTFFEAKDAARRSSLAQSLAEDEFKRSSEAASQAEAAYRMELGKEITRLRADGNSVTLVPDLARGAERIAQLKLERDVCLGVLDAAKQALWRHTADRRDVQSFISWSLQVSTGRAMD
ncbi:hypothetical protein UFOVP1346_37 [uncultured Caudovirales phage]|uniref:Uncharacterized protein n=1 Tax=uncultured Caudovirales phage TaxID=2100421 RepID=A0A6J5RSL1_9CAUD|nr:hypothetical protein UFOVP921_17 [uncultured Caudovirales phage]CAB4187721.1 hypothetical protein UFOVP1156_53 [uncultured Caudovirales phage]CAB4200372.1 hypothetical protein UFOVP1346_37 [uncultured Caudovirales phage]